MCQLVLVLLHSTQQPILTTPTNSLTNMTFLLSPSIGSRPMNCNLSKFSTLTSTSYHLPVLQKRMTSTAGLDIFEAMGE